jgi:hypothetical protein
MHCMRLYKFFSNSRKLDVILDKEIKSIDHERASRF